MVNLQALLKKIDHAPDGPSVAAIFDFDGTLISGYSALAFLREQIRRGHLSRGDIVDFAGSALGYARGTLEFSGLIGASGDFLRGASEKHFVELGEELFRDKIARRIYPESRALVNAHISKGHTVAIISSATPYQVMPAARNLGIDHVLCSRLEVEDGVFTGSVERPLCFGQGKVIAAEKLSQDTGADLASGFFYSDSKDDLQLLERVGHPVVLNPSSQLRSIAEKRGWPVARFESPEKTGIGSYARSAATAGALAATYATSLPVRSYTRIGRKARSLSYSLFADIATQLIKLDLDVTGDKHLWQQRPAVFIYNRQSRADPIILAKLLRQNVASVGGQALRDTPVVGKILDTAGMILVENRESSRNAEAIKRLCALLKDQGTSVVIAPEERTSDAGNLGPFGETAFRLAMQAGVPIVPIVFNNINMAPREESVSRPGTVRVNVLPPLDTSRWTLHHLSNHIAEVRSMFLSILEQGDDPAGSATTVCSEGKPRRSTKAKTAAAEKAARKETRSRVSRQSRTK